MLVSVAALCSAIPVTESMRCTARHDEMTQLSLLAGTGSATPCGPSGTCCSGTCIVPSGCRGTTYAGAICCPSARCWPLDILPQATLTE